MLYSFISNYVGAHGSNLQLRHNLVEKKKLPKTNSFRQTEFQLIIILLLKIMSSSLNNNKSQPNNYYIIIDELASLTQANPTLNPCISISISKSMQRISILK